MLGDRKEIQTKNHNKPVTVVILGDYRMRKMEKKRPQKITWKRVVKMEVARTRPPVANQKVRKARALQRGL